MHSKPATRQVVSPVSTTGSVAPFDPQTPITLQPGESIYDPNTQGLLTTPSPIDTTSGDAGTGNQVTSPAAPAYTVNVNYPRPHKIAAPKHPKAQPHKNRPRKVKVKR